MLRLSEIKLPLDHTDEDLHSAILKKLRIKAAELTQYTVFKRSYDARKRGDIRLVYIIDLETPKQKQLLSRFKKDPHVLPTPDTSYRYVAEAPKNLEHRPVVIGNRPCGMFAGQL